METLGMNLSEGKALLAGMQDFVIAQQANEYLEQQRTCPACGQRYTSKDSGNFRPGAAGYGRRFIC
jgi:uncharacterized protein (DUF983 family)